MNPLAIYLGALGLFGFGSIFIRNTNCYSRTNGAKNERKRKRKILGELLLIAAIVLLVLAVVTQMVSSVS
jgi:hypothetical protein